MPRVNRLEKLMKTLSPDKDTLLKNIRDRFNISGSANNTSKQDVSNGFEYLVSQWFSEIWQVNFIDSSVEGQGSFVKWFGSVSNLSGAKSGDTDTLACFYGYKAIIESTLITNAHQSSKEYAPSVRHFDALVKQGVLGSDSYIILVSPEIHQDTFSHFKSDHNHQCVLWTVKQLQLIYSKIKEIRAFRVTLTHFRLQELIIQSSRFLKTNNSFADYEAEFESFLKNWLKDTLKENFSVLLTMASYRFLRERYANGHKTIGATEVMTALQENRIFQDYISTIAKVISVSEIKQAIEAYRIAKMIELSYQLEPLFTPFDLDDIEFEYRSFIRALS